MPRQARIEIPGAIYHVITRGIERKEIFKDEADREEFLKRLAEGLQKTGSRCYGWSVMPNHFHLIIRTGTKSLSELMRRVLTGYAIYFNKKYRRSGYLFQNRYKSILCQEEVYLLELVRYVHLNPVRSGTVKDMEGLDKYKWTGHSVIVGKEKREWQNRGEVLERFGERMREAIMRYRSYVSDGAGMGKREDLTGGGLRRSAGGWMELLKMKRDKEYWRGDERILGDGEFVNAVLKQSEEEMKKEIIYKREGLNLEKVINKVCLMTSVKREDLKRRGRENNISKAKGLISYWGNKELGISRNEIAKVFGISGWAVSKLAGSGERVAAKENLKLLSSHRPIIP